jgi:hypothetical protein
VATEEPLTQQGNTTSTLEKNITGKGRSVTQQPFFEQQMAFCEVEIVGIHNLEFDLNFGASALGILSCIGFRLRSGF